MIQTAAVSQFHVVTTPPPVDPARVEAFMGSVIGDLSSALHGALTWLGDRLGIFKAMAGAGPLTEEQVARRADLSIRYLREWLQAMATAGYVEHDRAERTWTLPDAHAAVLADEESPAFLGGLAHAVHFEYELSKQVLDAFRTGAGVPVHRFPESLAEAQERLTAPGFKHGLVQAWIPAMPDVQARLEAGAAVLDVGCGAGLAAIRMAQAYPRARITGCDLHAPSIERARVQARAAGVEDRVTFEARDCTRLPRETYDLVTAFDVIHDLPDPVAALSAIRNALRPDGTFLWVEFSHDAAESSPPLRKALQSASTLYCVSVALAGGGEALGNLFTEEKARELADAGGFSGFRRLPVEDPMQVLYALRR
jgi:ubiquinone/menaquinone biosynthesis C-methylase UbiE